MAIPRLEATNRSAMCTIPVFVLERAVCVRGPWQMQASQIEYKTKKEALKELEKAMKKLEEKLKPLEDAKKESQQTQRAAAACKEAATWARRPGLARRLT